MYAAFPCNRNRRGNRFEHVTEVKGLGLLEIPSEHSISCFEVGKLLGILSFMNRKETTESLHSSPLHPPETVFQVSHEALRMGSYTTSIFIKIGHSLQNGLILPIYICRDGMKWNQSGRKSRVWPWVTACGHSLVSSVSRRQRLLKVIMEHPCMQRTSSSVPQWEIKLIHTCPLHTEA